MAATSVVARAAIVVGCLWLCSGVPGKKARGRQVAQAPTPAVALPGCSVLP